MTHKYFGGESRNLGEARILAAKSFRDFVGLLLAAPVVLPLTRAQYQNMSPSERSRAKRVKWFCPSAFPSSPAQRVTENARGISLIVIDIDDPEHAKPLTASRLSASLQPFSWVVYRTASSTPDAPRLRVVVDAELRPEEYVGAVSTVARLLGLPSVTRESKVVVQPSFLPSLFADEDPDLDHPLLASEVNGRTFIAQDIDSVDMLPSAAATARPQAPDAGDGLEFLRAPMPGVSIEAAREALAHLDPDMPMHDWVCVAFALRHQFGDEAYDVFLDWSEKGKKFAGEKDVEARWKSAKAHTAGRAPVTIRSLLNKARNAGWKGMGAVSAEAYDAVSKAISALTTPTALLEGAPKAIAHSILSPVERGALLGQVCKQAKALGMALSRRDIEKSIARLSRTAASGDGETGGRGLPAWARGWVYVVGEDEFFRPVTGSRAKPEPFNRANSREVEASDDDETKPSPSWLLLNEYRCPTVEGYQYDPSRPEDVVFEDEIGRIWANTYQARHPRGETLGSEYARSVFLGHLDRIVGCKDSARRLMDWLAYHVQAPGVKVRWAPLIQGTQGCGKSYIADVMAAVLGRQNVRQLDASQVLEDGFNGWGNEAQLVVLEEVRVVGESRFKVMNKLKPLITNSTVSIRRMYREAVNVKNVTNYLLLTNFQDSLPVDENDRRYFVIHSPLQTKAQKDAVVAPHLPEMWKCLETNASGLRAMFEEWQISEDFRPDGDAPNTASKSELVRNTETPIASLLRRLLEEATNPLINNDFVSTTALRREADIEGIRYMSDQMLSQACREAGYGKLGRKSFDGERHRVWFRTEVVYDEDGL